MRLTGLSDIAARTVRTASANAGDKVTTAAPPKAVGADDAIGVATVIGEAGIAPTFDAERVAEIRKAIKEHRYPLVPARIADAMIAAKLYGMVDA